MSRYSSPTTVDLTDNPVGLFAWLNDVTNFWFSNMLLIVIWVMFLMGYLAVNKDDYAGGFAVASYVVMVLSLIGWLMNLVSGFSFGIALGVSMLATAILLGTRNT